MNAINPLPLPPKEASRYLLNTFNISCATGTLAKYRCSGEGPLFRKVGSSIFYDIEELKKWVYWRTFIRRSTSDVYPVQYPIVSEDCDVWEALGVPACPSTDGPAGNKRELV